MLTEITRPNALFLSVLAQFNYDLGKNICDWFSDSKIIFEYNNQEIIDFTASLLSNPDYNFRINEVIGKSDLGFSSIESKIKDISQRTNKSEKFIAAILSDEIKTYTLLTKHKKYSKNKHTDNVYFDLMANESMGSQKYFGLLGPDNSVAKEGKFTLD